MAYKINNKDKTVFSGDIHFPEEYCNLECIYKITANGKVVYIGFTHNLYLELFDLIKCISSYGVDICRYRGMRVLLAFGYDLELEPMDEANYDKFLDYINEYKPMLNSDVKNKYFDGIKTITKEEKSKLQTQLQYSLGYITGDNEAVYYIDKQMNSYRVLR